MVDSHAHALVDTWMTDHPTVKDAVGWRPTYASSGLFGDVIVRGARHFCVKTADVYVNGAVDMPVRLMLNFALDAANVLAVQLIGSTFSGQKRCAASLHDMGDTQAGAMLDIIMNNLTGFRWKENVRHGLQAPD